MKFTNIVLATLFSTSTVTANQATGSFKIDFNVERSEPRFVKRTDVEGTVLMELSNQKILYVAELQLGSNHDDVVVHVDTGSADLWVPATDVNCTKENPFAALLQGQAGNNNNNTEQSSKSVATSRRNKRADDQVYSALNSSDEPLPTNVPEVGNTGVESNSSSAGDNTQPVASNTCIALGAFNTEASETFENNGTNPFMTLYGDGDYALGVWVRDTIKIGNVSISDVTFAVANRTSNVMGVLGIGLRGLEATSQLGYVYDNLPYKMKADGVINKVLYSLYLNEADAKSGSVLFGAIDHAKYKENLETIPIVEGRDGTLSDFSVELKQISLSRDGNSDDLLQNSTNVILDSGSTVSYLLPHQLEAVGQAFDGELSDGKYKVDCELLNSNSTLDLTFGSKIINVPVSKLILPQNETSCYLGILPQPQEQNQKTYALFGDNILRSAYIVYDLEDLQVQIAQARYTDEEDIRVVGGKESTRGASGTNSTSNGTDSGDSGIVAPNEQESGGDSVYKSSWIFVLSGLIIPLCLV
ncbi:Eukaryotic aspartyl protease family protein [Candida parapsilosis]|uniref:candidapepsin n=2 Tax=Candida parapsilosis TaxID=5480 RepID=G8BKJ4_CANPC|nr:uncharacterized protein CPAR2_702730 [Candida parapsilosis]KAF6042165.1 Eukaryotic aspartyl protease family protein [Candida parapsilosis]KAF6042444.1 Eukaryotic aspartyl protease family protein [Candida parapsilosis]KAF6042889.1 Eukaryotic aspartyl protease family protein [Candida parapsilosis]KAF6058102.1 Eukaryotic aspartyl protease family protein [Candida parapsilosis]CCE45260.1 hypothetical protein CPAR2_702730 [Candida parapsilosis]